METKTEKVGKSKAKLTITVPAGKLAKHFKHAYDELSPSVKLAGFRPGKAPRKMIEDALGISKLLSHAVDSAVRENYVLALDKEKLMPVAPPKITINRYPNYGLTADEIAEALEFEAEIEIFPQVEIGDYKKLKVDAGKPEKVKADDVEKVISHLQRQRATFHEADRPIQRGDFAEISFEGSLKGIKIDQMSSKNHPLIIGESNLIPGFEDQILGMKKEGKKTFRIKFPKDYLNKEFAGKEAEFEVKLENLKEVKLPEVDDDFVKKLGRKDVADLKQAVEKNLQEEINHKYQHELEEKVIAKVLPLVKAEIPESLTEQEKSRIINSFKHQLERQGLELAAYLKSMKKNREQFEKEIAPQAEKNVRVGLLLGNIIREQKIDDRDPEAGKKALDYLVKTLTKAKKG